MNWLTPKSKPKEQPRDPHEKPVIDTGIPYSKENIPFFSVCIPTYNRADLLPTAIESVLSQDFDDFELIICDNASTDNTEEVVSSYQDRRIRYVRYENLVSMYANHNRCINLSRANWLLFIHSDDLLLPFTLKKYYQAISNYQKTENIAIFFSNFSVHPYSHTSNPLVGKEALYKFLQYGFFPPTCNVFNTNFLKKNKLYFQENTVFADSILLCEICFLSNKLMIPVPEIKQTWSINKGACAKIFTSYLNVEYWNDISYFLQKKMTKDLCQELAQKMTDWEINQISHLLYRFASIEWWECVDLLSDLLKKEGISIEKGHYYKHIIIIKTIGKYGHKFVYSIIKLRQKINKKKAFT